MKPKFVNPFTFCCKILLLVMFVCSTVQAQTPPATTVAPTATTDTLPKKSNRTTNLNAPVKYSAEDSIRFDRINNVVYLYGRGRVSYEDFELDADFIRLDQKNNTVFASGIIGANNRYTGRPLFKSGNEPPISTDSLIYNFETRKGKSYGVFSEVEGGYLSARQFKKNEYEEGFFRHGLYSTCNLPYPHQHYGINITRGIVTEKQIVTGPAYLEVEGVPLPLGVPFGIFPKPERRASGILFPTFGEDFNRGFYIRDLGYYVGLNEYWDLALRGTAYSKGSFETSAAARYRKNYRYDGSLNFRFASTRTGIEGTPGFKPSRDFNIQWSHSQSPQVNPGTTFSASVNAGTASYFVNTAAGGSYDFNQLTRNSLSSNISYGKTFANGLFNFTSTLSHRQDLTSKQVFLELPSFNLNMSTLNPFDSKDRAGEQKWYQRIAVGYSLQGTNSIDTREDQLFESDALRKLRTGFQHNIPVSLSLNVLKHFQFNSGLRYNERWYLQSIRKQFNPASPASPLIDTVQGFSRAYEYDFNSGLSTKLYGQLNFRRGRVEAIRHVMTPSVSFNYRPDFSSEGFGFYRPIQVDPSGRIDRYSIFEQAVYGSPSRGKVAGIGFNIDNNFEGKRRSRDTSGVSEKFQILPSLSLNGNYNFAADSMKLSAINFFGRTSLFRQKVGVSFSGAFDPYLVNSAGIRLNRFAISEGTLARLTNLNLSMDFSLNSTALRKRSDRLNEQRADLSNLNPQQAMELSRISNDPHAFVDFNIHWNITASYNFNYSRFGLQSSITNTLNFFGDLSITPKWKVQYSSGYDFQNMQASLTQISIYRDLHCWDLSFRWIPFGLYRSYSVDLRVRSSILQDLKLSRRRDYSNIF